MKIITQDKLIQIKFKATDSDSAVLKDLLQTKAVSRQEKHIAKIVIGAIDKGMNKI